MSAEILSTMFSNPGVPQPMPSMAIILPLISNISRGSRSGKLMIAIKVKLFPALKAIPETMVRILENATIPSKNIKVKSVGDPTGLPITKE